MKPLTTIDNEYIVCPKLTEQKNHDWLTKLFFFRSRLLEKHRDFGEPFPKEIKTILDQSLNVTD